MTLVQLAFANAVVLAPGWALARAFGVRSVSATLAWAFVVVFAALALTIAVGGSLTLTLVFLLLVAAVRLYTSRGLPRGERVPGRRWVLAAGVLLGLLIWPIAGEIGGDGLFHLARARKLEAFDSLSLDAVNEFADGGLHPGYAFPLWHGYLALVARVGFLDPASVVLHQASVFAPLAVMVVYEAGYALFRRVGPALAVVGAQVTVTALAPAHGGAYTALGLPATGSRQLLLPAAVALALGACVGSTQALRRASLASAAAAGLALAVVHPTYAIFLWLPFAGFLVVRSLVARDEAGRIAAALGALVLPAAAYLLWLLPVVRETASVDPGGDELRRAFRQYAGQLDVFSETSYRLAPEVFGRAGAVAIAALLAVPLAGLALRRRWSAYVLGGFLAVAAVMLVPQLFVAFSDLVSISQSRRAAGFWPLAFAFAGGCAVLATLLRGLVVPAALAAGIVLQLVYPGEFAYRLEDGGPALVTWLAAAGGVVALVGGLVLIQHKRSLDRADGLAAVAAAAFLLPVAVAAIPDWTASPGRKASPLTPGLVGALRERVPEGDVVFSDPETSYRIAAAAPVHVASAPPGHVADTEANRPYERRDDARRFFATANLSIPRRAGADWLVVDTERAPLPPTRGLGALADRVFADDRFELYRLP